MVVATKLSTVNSRQVAWLWPRRFALSKLSLLCGDPGVGKSFLTCWLAAVVSRGGELPDGGRAPLGSVVLLSAEDGVEDTIKPRLEAAGADLDRISILSGIHDLRRDCEKLAWQVRELGDCKLVVIDPVAAYLPNVDSHKDAEVRTVLAPLSRLAESEGVSLVVVQHLNKNESASGVHRVCGSIAFPAAARNVWQVVQHGPERILKSLKNNVGVAGLEISYRIHGGRVVWQASQAEPMAAAEADLTQDGYSPEEISLILGAAR